MASLTLEAQGKGVVVKGDTLAVKDFLKTKGGSWNKFLKGWMFPGSKKAQLLTDLQNCSNVSSVQDKTGSGGAPAPVANSAPAADPAPVASSKKRDAPDEPAASEQPAASSKRAKASNEEEVSADGPLIKISDTVFVQIIGGKVDVRRFYKDRDSGEMKPSSKGIRLGSDEWKEVCNSAKKIDSAGEEGIQIVECVRAQGKDGRIDIRRQYVDKNDGLEKPTKKGANLSAAEWDALKSHFTEINEALNSSIGSASAASTPAASARKRNSAASADDSDRKPKPKHEFETKLRELLKEKDMATVTLKQVRGDLETVLGLAAGSLDTRKDEIKALVTQIVNEPT
jgi:hypothetical protein